MADEPLVEAALAEAVIAEAAQGEVAAVAVATEAEIDAASAEASARAAEQAAQGAVVAAQVSAAVADANAAQTITVVAQRMDELWTKFTNLETTLAEHSHPELMTALNDLRAETTALSSLIRPPEEAAAEVTEQVAVVEPGAGEVAPVVVAVRRRGKVL